MLFKKLHNKKISNKSVVDIKELDDLRQSVRDYKEQCQTIIEMMPAAVFIETLDGKVIDCNQQAVLMTGFSKKELLSISVVDLVPEEVVKDLPKIVDKELKDGGFQTQTYNRRKNGEIFPVEVVGKVISIQGRKYVIIMVTDLSQQVNAEKAIFESEERFKAIFELSPDAYYLIDIKGKIIETNRATEKMVGKSRFNFLGKNIFSIGLMEKKDMPRAMEMLRANLLGKSSGPEEFIINTKNGKIIVEVISHPVLIRGETVVLGIVRNVTDKKLFEKELKIRDEKLMHIVNKSSNVIIISFDKNARILSWNAAAEITYGLKDSEVKGKVADNVFLDKSEFERLKDVIKQIDKNRQPIAPLEFYAYDKSGNMHIALVSFFPVTVDDSTEFISVAIDITTRKKVEQQLHNRNEELNRIQKNLTNSLAEEKKGKEMLAVLAKDLEKFKLAVDSASDHIIITDIDANVIFANKAAQKITGYTQNEIIGKNPGKLWGGQMPKEYFKKMWKVIKTDKAVFVGELTNKRKNGELYTAEVNISPILNIEQEVVFFVGIERDISKTKEVEKMKNEFVTVASHQLRTPLTTVKWYAELLLSVKDSLNKKEFGYIQKIYESNQKMIRLVNDLLNVSRIETRNKFVIDKHKINLSDLIKRSASDQETIAEQLKVGIKLEKLPDQILLNADNELLYQVLQNLIHNAVAYSRAGSNVYVGCKNEDKQIVVYVRDSGIGIPSHQQERIFEKFFRGENVTTEGKSGTGLGLFIARAIIEGHGGKIWFESEENKGTTFYFTLPKNNIKKK